MNDRSPSSDTHTEEGTRARLVRAMIEVVGSEGLAAASVRTIARRAGCNEAVLYQHFPSKLAMQQAIYEEIVRDMAETKRAIGETAATLEELVERWVAETFAFYDHNPAAFAYVYLSFPQLPLSDPSIATENSRLFLGAFSRLDKGFDDRIASRPELIAMAKGVLLSVPREIHEGVLDGPAVDHAASVASAVLAILGGRSG